MTSGGGAAEALDAAKQALRSELLAARRALDPVRLAAARADVVRHVLAGLPASVGVVAAYEPLRTEPGSVELLVALAASGRRVLVPVTYADHDLGWAWWSQSTAREDLGRDAITTADALLVPALAVAPGGARLGRGGGSYDRALPRARGRIVALLHRGERRPDLPVGPHDVPVDAVVTPDGWIAPA